MQLSTPLFFTVGSIMTRITKTTHTRRYRFSKKNPRGFKQVTVYDLGNVEQSTHLSFSPSKNGNMIKMDLETSKEPNPNLIRFRFGNGTVAYYTDSEKGFVYDKLGFL